MSNRAVIHASDAPQAIGPYSQAVKINNVVYMSGQIPLDPATMQLVAGRYDVLCDPQGAEQGRDLLARLTI